MPRMKLSQDVFAYVIALAAVVNGLGLVRLMGGVGDYLRMRRKLTLIPYWPHVISAIFQLLLHILLWWSVLGLKAAGNITFLTYLYLLAGPGLLFLATSVIVPDVSGDSLDLRPQYYGVRKIYYSILSVFWLWAIFLWPAFGYPFAPTASLASVWLAIAIVLRLTANEKVHSFLVIANLVVYATFVAIFAMNLVEVGRQMTQ